MGAISLIWTLFIIYSSTSVLGDAITGLGFQIAFYYGLTGFACTVYYRKEIFKSAAQLRHGRARPLPRRRDAHLHLRQGLHHLLRIPTETETGKTFLGFGVPVAIGVGLIVVGVVFMVWANFAYPKFFKRKPEVADPGILEGTVVGEASVMAD